MLEPDIFLISMVNFKKCSSALQKLLGKFCTRLSQIFSSKIKKKETRNSLFWIMHNSFLGSPHNILFVYIPLFGGIITSPRCRCSYLRCPIFPAPRITHQAHSQQGTALEFSVERSR